MHPCHASQRHGPGDGVGNAVPENAEEPEDVLEGVLKEVQDGASRLYNELQEIKTRRLLAEAKHQRSLRRRQRAAALEAATEVQRARSFLEKERRSMGREDRLSAAMRKRKAEQEQNEEKRLRTSWNDFLNYGVRWRHVKEALDLARERENALEKAREEALEIARARGAPPQTPTMSNGFGDSRVKASTDSDEA